jgi:chromosome 3 open reading frame 10
MSSDSVSSTTVQSDWSRREVAESIQMQILKMTEFLNKFHLSTRHRLSTINERINTLERTLDNVECSITKRDPTDAE